MYRMEIPVGAPKLVHCKQAKTGTLHIYQNFELIVLGAPRSPLNILAGSAAQLKTIEKSWYICNVPAFACLQ